MDKEDGLKIGERFFSSRLFIGTGKYASSEAMKSAISSSEASIVTVALRRVDFDKKNEGIMEGLLDFKGLVLPNTSGARNADEAIRLARLGAELLGHRYVKLELTPNQDHFLPDPVETYFAAKKLAEEGFSVMPYINADPVLAKKLEDVGCVCVMPLGAPIGSNQGIVQEKQIRIIIENARVPVVVDAGIGAPSHAALAMEMGSDAVLVNTAIAIAGDPTVMARSFKEVVAASRRAYLAKIPSPTHRARASSPLTDFLRNDKN